MYPYAMIGIARSVELIDEMEDVLRLIGYRDEDIACFKNAPGPDRDGLYEYLQRLGFKQSAISTYSKLDKEALLDVLIDINMSGDVLRAAASYFNTPKSTETLTDRFYIMCENNPFGLEVVYSEEHEQVKIGKSLNNIQEVIDFDNNSKASLEIRLGVVSLILDIDHD